MTSPVVFRALQPQPLGSYLAALGVLRICASQRDAGVRGAYGSEGFALHGIERATLVAFLLDDYVPSPVLTPWNNASGFYDSSKGRLAVAAIDALGSSGRARFAPLVGAIQQIRALVRERGYEDAPADHEKADFISSLRGVLADDAVAWLDAAAAVARDDARMMPLLGSGGNEGVLDYSSLFLRSLVDVLLGDRARSERLLIAALDGAISPDLVERPGGQFDPGTAGGFNTGPGIESKNLPNNPWSFILLVEGTLVWASAIASRQQGGESGYGFAVSPFTVAHRASGHGSASARDADTQKVRAEVWVPVWRRPATLAEISRYIAEGRMDVRGRVQGTRRRATDSLDFANAVASHGVDRGVETFVRYAFTKRRGDSYIALPAGVMDVRRRREVDLARELDRELDIFDRFLRRFKGEGPPAQLAIRRRAIDDARFEVAKRGGADAMRDLVRALGSLEMLLARRDPSKEPKLWRPLGGLSSEWVGACGDDVEIRLAAAIASLVATGGAAAIRAYLAPVDPTDARRYAAGPRTVSWTGVDLADRMAHTLRRRLLDVQRREGDRAAGNRNPTWGTRRASLSDIALFLDGDLVDERAVEELIFGFTWMRPSAPGAAQHHAREAPPLPRSYAQLKLLFLPGGISRGDERVALMPDPAILTLLRSGRVADALEIARRQLVANGFHPRRVVDAHVDDATLGRRLAAALLVPVTGTQELITLALLPIGADADRPPHPRQESSHG